MATCPHCGTSSRKDPTAITCEYLLSAKPLGTWSLSGTQLKTVLRGDWRMYCRCGWSILGRMEDGSFLGYADTQVFPASGASDEEIPRTAQD